jgi:hypothetical protein
MTVRQVGVAALVTLTLGGCADDPGPTDGPVAPRGRFELVWSDEFDGPGIDEAKWYVRDGHVDAWPETPWRRNYKKENVYVENGALVIRTVREPNGFSTGAIRTASWGEPTKFEQAFGRFEARMRFPTQQGHWCAFWLMNKRVGEIDGSGRDGTEIDILEKAWLIDQAQHALHWEGYGPRHETAYEVVTGLGLDDGGWHVARVDWYPSEKRGGPGRAGCARRRATSSSRRRSATSVRARVSGEWARSGRPSFPTTSTWTTSVSTGTSRLQSEHPPPVVGAGPHPTRTSRM